MGPVPEDLARKLESWFERCGRELPWRGTGDAYRVWISEIMLQQTRIEAVKGYYDRFLAAFPTLTALAAAGEEQVLKAWEGLGYYSRARNLHRTAGICAPSLARGCSLCDTGSLRRDASYGQSISQP